MVCARDLARPLSARAGLHAAAAYEPVGPWRERETLRAVAVGRWLVVFSIQLLFCGSKELVLYS